MTYCPRAYHRTSNTLIFAFLMFVILLLLIIINVFVIAPHFQTLFSGWMIPLGIVVIVVDVLSSVTVISNFIVLVFRYLYYLFGTYLSPKLKMSGTKVRRIEDYLNPCTYVFEAEDSNHHIYYRNERYDYHIGLSENGVIIYIPKIGECEYEIVSREPLTFKVINPERIHNEFIELFTRILYIVVYDKFNDVPVTKITY